MLGGLIWETGNVLSIPIIQRIGMGMGLIVWGISALVIGWFTGYFGWFGLKSEKNDIHDLPLSIGGLCIALLSLVVAFRVKKTTSEEDGKREENERSLLEEHLDSDANLSNTLPSSSSYSRRHIEGIVLAIIAGIFFGSNFDPPSWVQDHVDDASQDDMDYVFCKSILSIHARRSNEH